MFYLEDDIKHIIDQTKNSLDKLNNKTIAITGSHGFLGKYFLEVIRQYKQQYNKSITIVAIDNFITSDNKIKNIDLQKDGVSQYLGDASDLCVLDYKYDYIIHSAGIASPENYKIYPLETIDVSTNITRKLLEKAKLDKSKFLFFSSSEMYGDPSNENVPTKETYRGNVSCHGSRAAYDESKRMGETICWVYQTYFDVFVSIVRPFNIYGPGMMPNDYRVFPNFAKSVLSKEPLKVYGSGKQTRAFCYITDAIISCIKILIDAEKPDVFNIGNDQEEISLIHLAEKIINQIDNSLYLKIVPYPISYPDDEPNRRCPNIDKYNNQFGKNNLITLEEGINKFFDWASIAY